MTISQTTQELLKAHVGRGFSDDPALTARHKIRLLPEYGASRPGTSGASRDGFFQSDEAATCTSRRFAPS